MDERVGDLGEDAVIAIFAGDRRASSEHLVVDNGDDAAVWAPKPGEATVATTDSLVQGVHFDLEYASPRATGRKLVSISLSDIAAMGAEPRYALVAVHLPKDLEASVVRALGAGVLERCAAYGVCVAGGNVTSTAGPIVLSLTLIGAAPPEQIITRTGARVGDALFVTGTLGDARAALQLALRGAAPSNIDALVDPVPRVEAGIALARSGVVRAMCDVSDGLARDVRDLFRAPASSANHEAPTLGAQIDEGALPISNHLRNTAIDLAVSASQLALLGGEDYELLFVADPADVEVVQRACAHTETPVTRIGTIIEGATCVRRVDGTVEALAGGFDHFQG